MQFDTEFRLPTVKEYQKLRATTGWSHLPDKVVAIALANSLFSVCVIQHDSIIGTGRIIGDGALYFYIQDVIVLPQFQKSGVGTQIMNELEAWLTENAPQNAFIGLMAAVGVKRFYRKFGYVERDREKPGMFKIIQK